MSEYNWTIAVFALIGWALYFYLLNGVVMEAQGLPVGWTLMPE